MIACSRCGGWLERSSDQDGSYIHCLICGAHYAYTQEQRPAQTPEALAKLRADQKEAEREYQQTIRAERKREYQRQYYYYYHRPEVQAKRRERGGGTTE